MVNFYITNSILCNFKILYIVMHGGKKYAFRK